MMLSSTTATTLVTTTMIKRRSLSLSLDDALNALIQLHTPYMTQLLQPDSTRLTDDERKVLVQDLGISDVRDQALHP